MKPERRKVSQEGDAWLLWSLRTELEHSALKWGMEQSRCSIAEDRTKVSIANFTSLNKHEHTYWDQTHTLITVIQCSKVVM